MIVGRPFGDAPSNGAKNGKGIVVRRVIDLVHSAEKMLSAAAEHAQRGDYGTANLLRKRSRDKAHRAMKVMGPLVWDFGLDMKELIARAKKVADLSRMNGGGYARAN